MVSCLLVVVMSGDSEDGEAEEWMRAESRLEEIVNEAMALIDVGEEGWLERFGRVVACVTAFENRGRQVVMQTLVWRLGSEGVRKGLDCGESVVKMSEVMEDLRRRHVEEAKERGEELMMMMESPLVYREWRRRMRRLVDMVASVLTVMEDAMMRWRLRGY